MSDFNLLLKKSSRLKLRHPDRIPVIISPSNFTMSQYKFLPKKDSTYGDLLYMMRHYVYLSKEQAIFGFINKFMIPVSATIGDLYNVHGDADGYLHISMMTENTFG